MHISRQEAVSLLQKWKDERLLLKAHLSPGGVTGSTTLGRIDQLDNERIEINGLTLAFGEVVRFSFEDKRFTGKAERHPRVVEHMKELFDSFLFMELGCGICTIVAIDPE